MSIKLKNAQKHEVVATRFMPFTPWWPEMLQISYWDWHEYYFSKDTQQENLSKSLSELSHIINIFVSPFTAWDLSIS